MKLSSAREGQVVRNAKNGSHYRFERLERRRVRIRPLEHFPSGLLVEKPTDTTVEGDLDVVLIGDWAFGMVVEGKPDHSRKTYERELLNLREKLVDLEEGYENLPSGGKGKQSRGSWANKLKATRTRIQVLETGLGVVDSPVAAVAVEAQPQRFQAEQVVQLPSGLPAILLGTRDVGDGSILAEIKMRYRGRSLVTAIPAVCLRDWSHSRVCTS